MIVGMGRVRACLAVALSWTLLGLFAAMLRVLPFRFVSRVLGRPMPPAALPVAEAGAGPRARAVRLAVIRAARLAPFRADCLPQALCASVLCRLRGLPTTTLLGVRHENGHLSAHAWVVADGITVSGGAEQPRFRPVACFARPGRDACG